MAQAVPMLAMVAGSMIASKMMAPKAPKPPPVPDEIGDATDVPGRGDEKVAKARDETRRKAIAARGRDDTILTSPGGLESMERNTRKTILGR